VLVTFSQPLGEGWSPVLSSLLLPATSLEHGTPLACPLAQPLPAGTANLVLSRLQSGEAGFGAANARAELNVLTDARWARLERARAAAVPASMAPGGRAALAPAFFRALGCEVEADRELHVWAPRFDALVK